MSTMWLKSNNSSHYGKPCDENIKKAERGEIILAGCRRPNNPPKYACKKCKKRF